MSDAILSDAEREALLGARFRLLKLPPERIVPAQTAPVTALAQLVDALDGDATELHTTIAAFIKAINELCDGALRKNGRVNVSAVEAAEHGLDALAHHFALDLNDPVAALRTIRDARAADRSLDVPAIDAQVEARAQARKAKDFDTADRLHQALVAQGIVVIDDADGSNWTLTG